MLQNPFFRVGVLIVVASALLWLGAELSRRIEWILPYTAGFGLALVLVGWYVEARRLRDAVIATARNETGATGVHPAREQEGNIERR